MFMSTQTERISGTLDVGVQVVTDSADKEVQVEERHMRSLVETMIHNIQDSRESSITSLSKESDILLQILGEFGRWQFFSELLLFFINITYVFQIVVAEFEANLFGEYWCARPERLANIEVEKWKKISAVYHLKSGVTAYNPCFKKNMNYDDLDPYEPSTWIDKGGHIPCTSWEYEDSYSLIAEWNLACRNPSATSASETIFSIGGLVGSALSGYFADKQGRKQYIIFCLTTSIIIAIIKTFSPNFWFYLTLRGLQGFFIVGCYPVLTILSIELTTRTWGTLVGAVFMYSFPIGFLICSVLGYYSDTWRDLDLSLALLTSLNLFTWLLLPESPRWLWINAEFESLTQLVMKASRMNRKPLSEDLLERLLGTRRTIEHEDNLKVKWSDLYKTTPTRKLTIVASALFLFVFIAYYGSVLRLNIMFHMQFFTAYLIAACVEFSAITFYVCLAMRPWLKDTIVMFVACQTAGLLFFFVNSLSEDFEGTTYLLVVARFCMAVVNTNLLLYVSELYPTKMRGLGAGFVNSFNFLALLVIANFFRLDELRSGLPIFLMGLSAIVAGFLILLLPNPHHSRMIPDTISQFEQPYGS